MALEPNNSKFVQAPDGSYVQNPDYVEYERSAMPLESKRPAPEYVHQAWGTALSTAMGDPDAENRIKEQFKVVGRSQEWDSYREMYLRASDEKLAATVIERATREALAAGYTKPTPEMLKKHVIISEQEWGLTKAAPEVKAMVEGAAAGAMTAPDTTDQDLEMQQLNSVEKTYQIAQNQMLRKAEIMQGSIEEMRKIANDRGLPSNWTEVAAQIGLYALPFGQDSFYVKKLAEQIGLDASWLEQASFPLLFDKIQEYERTATPEQMQELSDKFLQLFKDSPNPLIQDWAQMMWMEKALDPQALAGGDPYPGWAQALDVLGLWFDAGGFAAGLKKFIGKGATKYGANVVLNGITEANKDQGRKALARVVSEPTGEDVGKWNVSKESVAATQFPKPTVFGVDGKIDDIPDGVLAEALRQQQERTMLVRSDIQQIQNTARETLYTEAEKLAATNRERDLIEKSLGGKVRMALSSIIQHDDGNGVRFDVTIGRNDSNGWLSEHNALRFAEKMKNAGVSNVEIWSSDGKNLTRVYADDGSWETALKFFNEGSAKPTTGNFYVRYSTDYFFNPSDKLMFGENPVIAPRFGFNVLKEILDPRSLFDENGVYKKYFANLFGEQAIAEKLQQLAHPILKMKPPQRRRIGNYYAQIETFGKENGRWPTLDELYDMFPNISRDDVIGLYTTKDYYDTIHWVQNDRLYREWKSKGFKTLKVLGTQTSYHGQPVERREVGASVKYLDPVSQEQITLSGKDLDELYKRGGTVIRTEIPISIGTEAKYSDLIIFDPAKKGILALEELSTNPLKYIPGYYPRIYKDNYYIYKVNHAATLNGNPTRTNRIVDINGTDVSHEGVMQIIAVAPTRAEAERFIALRRAEDPKFTFGIQADRRLSDKDKTSRDLELMQVEGRLFFDERNNNPLASTSGGFADIEDPINLLTRTSRMVARQVGSEELVRGLKQSFRLQYKLEKEGGILPNDFEFRRWSEIEHILKERAKGSELSAEALELWRYIRIMEASTNTLAGEFRKAAIRSVEALDRVMASKYSPVKMPRNVARWLYDTGIEWTPDKALKGAAHLVWIATRPLRQLFINAMQHTVLAGLDPMYAAGSMQKDAVGLMLGISARGATRSGQRQVGDEVSKAARVLMPGLSDAEYNRLITKYDLSGHRGIVDIHSFAGDLPLTSLRTSESWVGDVGQDVANLFRTPVRFMQNVGFDKGEHFNRAASYAMALNLHMKKNGYKSLLDIPDKEWTQISLRADDYAFSMHRANQFKYHRGWLSVPFQFLTFTHKAALVATTAITMGKVGTKTLEVGEAWRLMATNALLYGGAGFGIYDLTRSWLADNGKPQYIGTPIHDIIAGGFMDWGMDLAMQGIANDPELDMAWSHDLAPGAGIVNQMERFWQAGIELSPYDLAFSTSPSGKAIGNMWEAAHMGWQLFHMPKEVVTDQQKYIWITDALAQGFIGQYSDFWKWRVAKMRDGALTKSGLPKPNPESPGELAVRAALGIPSQMDVDQLTGLKDIKDRWDTIDKDTDEFYRQVVYVTQAYFRDGQFSEEAYLTKLNNLKVFLAGYDDPLEQERIIDRFLANDRNQKDRLNSLSYMISQGISQGKPPLQDIRERIASTKMIKDDKELMELLKLIDIATADTQSAADYNKNVYMPNEFERFKQKLQSEKK